ncbi:MAG: hypothetical protein WCG45_04160 [bacterium]
MEFKEWLNESHRGEIARLQPDSVITVFHGTDGDTAYDFCLNGIDGKKNTHRIYPHISGGKPLKFGLFVAPDLKTAQKFGSVIVKFKSLGKNLIYRFPVEMKKYNSSEFYKKQYPDSFRPIVSYDMLDRGVEPQALFIGMVSPRAIEKVFSYTYSDNKWLSFSPQEYIDYYLNKNKNKPTNIYRGIFEPQEYQMTLGDLVKRLAKEHNSTEEEILNTLKDIYKRNGYLTGVGNIPATLLRRIEQQLSKI